MQKERWLKSFTDSKIKSSRSFILENDIGRGTWHTTVTHPCNSNSLFKENHRLVLRTSALNSNQRWGLYRTGLSLFQNTANSNTAVFHSQALRCPRSSHTEIEESVFHSHREIGLLRDSGFSFVTDAEKRASYGLPMSFCGLLYT